jgi:hypothetical protein
MVDDDGLGAGIHASPGEDEASGDPGRVFTASSWPGATIDPAACVSKRRSGSDATPLTPNA